MHGTRQRPYGMVIIIQKEGLALGSSLEVALELLEAWGARSVPRGVCEQSVAIVIISLSRDDMTVAEGVLV